MFRISTTSVAGVALCLTVSGVAAQELRRLDLEEALRSFAERNLELRMARALAAGDEGAARQQAAFPNPVVSFTHENLGASGTDYAETYVLVDQEIDWPWRHAARRSSATSTATALAATVRRDSIRIAFEVKRTFVEAAAGERRLDVLREVLDVFRRADRAATARFADGDLSGYEVRRLRVELARYETAVAAQDLEMRRARRALTTLVFGESAVALAAPRVPLGPTPTVRAQNLVEGAMMRRPEIAAAAARVAAATEYASVARATRIPNLTLTGGYKTQTDGFTGLFVGARWPLPLFNRHGQDVVAGDARLDAARHDLRLTERLIVTDVLDAAEAYDAAVAGAALLTEGLLTGHRELLPIARASYAEGEMSLVELLDAAAAYWEAARTVIDVDTRSRLAYFALERAVGGMTDPEEGL